tara:strand:+ start:546 stop:1010 length:465 start_codon:yes stop_codon:yes gene_type:complete
MKMNLKNLKTAEHLSHETLAFSAVLYVDGKKTAFVENEGWGGSNSYHHIDPEARDRLKEAEEYAKEKTGHEFDGLDDLVGEMISAEDDWKTHRRREKIRVRFVDDGKLYEWNPKGKVGPMMLVKIKEVPWWKEANKMLNGLGKDEFLEAMKEVA